MGPKKSTKETVTPTPVEQPKVSLKTPTADKPTSSGKKALKVKKGGHKKSRHETFGVYIYKVLKQVHSDTGISKRSMQIMNSFINDIFEKVALESSKLVRYNKKHTLSAREIQSAVKLLLSLTC